MPPPIDPQRIDRLAELLAGAPCIPAEAYRAVGISDTKGKALRKDVGFQAKVKAAERTYSGDRAMVKALLREMLEATNDDGEPAYMVRKQAAELILKFPDVLDDDDIGIDEDALPAGVLRVYPSQYDDAEGEGEIPAPAVEPTPAPPSLPEVEAEAVGLEPSPLVEGEGEGGLDVEG